MDWIIMVSTFLSSQAFGVIIGGLITFGTSYLADRRKGKDEEKKRKEDRESQETELRNKAYIGFLGIRYIDAHPVIGIDGDTQEPICGDFHLDLLESMLAPVLTFGSPNVVSSLVKSYPLKKWEEVQTAKRIIMRELVIEKGGSLPRLAVVEEHHKKASAYINDTSYKQGSAAIIDGTKAKSWWQFWK